MKIANIKIYIDEVIASASDAHFGNGGRADNAVASKGGVKGILKTEKYFLWVFCGDMWEWWQFTKEQTEKAWSKISWFVKKSFRSKGNHDSEDLAPDMIIVKWGDKKIGFVHDTMFRYAGIVRIVSKWFVKKLWTPFEIFLGWKKSMELSSALDDENYEKYDKAAWKLLKKYDLDILLYGHIHPEKAYVIIEDGRAIVNTGRFQDGKCEFTTLTQVRGKINIALCRYTNRGKAICGKVYKI